MLLPIVFTLIFVFSKKDKSEENKTKRPKVPLFIIGFVLFSLLPTFHLIGEQQVEIIGKISHYLLIIAMSGIGLKITIKSMMKNGRSALIIGALIFLVQIIFTSCAIAIFY